MSQMTSANDEPESVIGAAAIRRIRIHTILEGITVEHIARDTGVCRETVSRRLRATDMRIDDYMVLCHSVGMDPVANLGEAIADSERGPCASPIRTPSGEARHGSE